MKIIKSILVIPLGLILGVLLGLMAVINIPIILTKDLLEDIWKE